MAIKKNIQEKFFEELENGEFALARDWNHQFKLIKIKDRKKRRILVSSGNITYPKFDDCKKLLEQIAPRMGDGFSEATLIKKSKFIYEQANSDLMITNIFPIDRKLVEEAYLLHIASFKAELIEEITEKFSSFETTFKRLMTGHRKSINAGISGFFYLKKWHLDQAPLGIIR